jgi:signal transduction histidine kinase
LEQQFEQLKYRVAGHPDQRLRIDTLLALLATRITLLDSSLVVSARQGSSQNNLRNIIVRTPYLMKRIVAVLNDLKQKEQELVDEIQAKTNQQHTNANNAIKFLGFTILAIFLSLIQLIFRTIKARTEAEANAWQLAATLEQKVKERTAQLHRLAAHLQDKREDEQRQLSREVNDEIGQLASAVKMDIDWLGLHITDADPKVNKRISNASKILQTLIDDVRKMASSLRPVMIDELGLNASIKWLCDQFAKTNGIPCVFTEEMDDAGIGQHIRTELYRICEEALINVTKHAHAQKVTVRLLQVNTSIELTITDDGNGFDAEHDSGQLGLIGIRERVLSINGSLRIETAKGRGTSVYVTVPVT